MVQAGGRAKGHLRGKGNGFKAHRRTLKQHPRMLIPGYAVRCAYVRACVRSLLRAPAKDGLLPNVTIAPRRNFYNIPDFLLRPIQRAVTNSFFLHITRYDAARLNGEPPYETSPETLCHSSIHTVQFFLHIR